MLKHENPVSKQQQRPARPTLPIPLIPKIS